MDTAERIEEREEPCPLQKFYKTVEKPRPRRPLSITSHVTTMITDYKKKKRKRKNDSCNAWTRDNVSNHRDNDDVHVRRCHWLVLEPTETIIIMRVKRRRCRLNFVVKQYVRPSLEYRREGEILSRKLGVMTDIITLTDNGFPINFRSC